MSANELLNVLASARVEILNLRRRNEILTAQAYVIDVFAAACGLRRNDGGESPDVAWLLQRKIDELTSPKEETQEK